MELSTHFKKAKTFEAMVHGSIPGNGTDMPFKFTAVFAYLTQDQVDAILDGEDIEIDGELVEADNDSNLLDNVLKGWKKWRISGEEVDYTEDNREAALNQIPIRSAVLRAFFDKLNGMGGKKRNRKN